MAVLDIVSETSRISGQLDVNKLFENIAFSKRFLAGFVSGIQRLTVSSSPRASLVMKEVEHGNYMLLYQE